MVVICAVCRNKLRLVWTVKFVLESLLLLIMIFLLLLLLILDELLAISLDDSGDDEELFGTTNFLDFFFGILFDVGEEVDVWIFRGEGICFRIKSAEEVRGVNLRVDLVFVVDGDDGLRGW